MSRRFKPRVLAHEATPPYHGYDSEIELPKYRSDLRTQNAWLTLKMRLHVNFVDSTNPTFYEVKSGGVQPKTGPRYLVQKIGTQFFAPDHDGWLFPIHPWPEVQKALFQRHLIRHVAQVWNYQFVLQTPANYDGFDRDYNSDGSARVRPNLICLFRPESAPRGARPHLAINILRLDPSVQQVRNLDGRTKSVPLHKDSVTFRSNSIKYDIYDSVPGWGWMGNKLKWERADTLGHEIGHALGQGHILEIQNKPCLPPFPGTTEPNCSGATDSERANIMAHGHRVYLDNAISWQKRAALHCSGTAPKDWVATGMMSTPPKLLQGSH